MKTCCSQAPVLVGKTGNGNAAAPDACVGHPAVRPRGDVQAHAHVSRQDAGHAHGHVHAHDHEHLHAHDHDHAHAASDHAGCASDPAIQHEWDRRAREAGTGPLHPAPGTERAVVHVEQMDCPTEARLITAKLDGMAGIQHLAFNFVQRTVTLDYRPGSLEVALKAISGLGFTPRRVDLPNAARPAAVSGWQGAWRLAVAGALALGAEFAHAAGAPQIWPLLLALLAVTLAGAQVYRKGWTAVRHGDLNINALMSIAVTGAVLIGHWPEAAMVMVLFAIAEKVEGASLGRARRAIEALLTLAPAQATVRASDGAWHTLDVARVALGSRVRVRPGERIALDGRVLTGHSTVDQAPITGESLPVDKAPGDLVHAGTINQAGELEFEATAAASDSLLARIIRVVESAQASRAPTQRFVDAFSRVYTPAVIALAAIVAVLPPLLGAGDFLSWAYRALVLLVVACPCALVISTPVTVVSGLAAAARQGILIKGGVHLEQGRHLTWLALDKTGTVTQGRPVQTGLVVLNGQPEAQLQALAGALAARSDHPVSRAIAVTARGNGLALDHVTDFLALPGQGVQAQVHGVVHRLGNRRLVAAMGCLTPALGQRIDALEEAGQTAVVLMTPDAAIAIFTVADSLKPGSRAAIDALHARGVRTVMLSGDNVHAVRAAAQQAGIDDARGDLLPEDKLAAVQALSRQGAVVGMVGDGINDAPALARADIGFAMGAMGTDTAIETADVAIMDDDLGKIARFIDLSRRTMVILRQNIALAIGIKAVFLALTVTGHATLWMAVFADVGVSLLVVANGLRTLRA